MLSHCTFSDGDVIVYQPGPGNNKAVVIIWRKGSTHNFETMALVYLLSICCSINIVITHISNTNNCIAVWKIKCSYEANYFCSTLHSIS